MSSKLNLINNQGDVLILEHDYTIPLDMIKDFDIDIEIAIDNVREDIDELVK